jgi:hypothetical protein
LQQRVSESSTDDVYGAEVDEVVNEGRRLLRDAHREVYSAMHRTAPGTNHSVSPTDTAPNMDLVPSVDDETVIYSAPVAASPESNQTSQHLHDEADKVLAKWYEYTVPWVSVAVHQAASDKLTADDFTRLLLVRREGKVSWRLQGLGKYVNVCQWFLERGRALFPSIDALARVWLSRSASNAPQERVFSTGYLVMGPLRTRTTNERA